MDDEDTDDDEADDGEDTDDDEAGDDEAADDDEADDDETAGGDGDKTDEEESGGREGDGADEGEIREKSAVYLHLLSRPDCLSFQLFMMIPTSLYCVVPVMSSS